MLFENNVASSLEELLSFCGTNDISGIKNDKIRIIKNMVMVFFNSAHLDFISII